MCLTVTACALGERHATFAIPAAPESASLARKMAGAVLRAWECDVDLDITILLVDEVFTNALLHGVAATHADAQVTVELVASCRGLHVEVHDPDQGTSEMVTSRHVGVHSETGRGLDLVEALSSSWGAKETTVGKYVFFDMAPREPPQDPDEPTFGTVPTSVDLSMASARGLKSQAEVSM